jgi:uncharacterized protein (TIGR02266 family)
MERLPPLPAEPAATAETSGVWQAMGERRSHPRYAVELDVSLDAQAGLYSGFTENLSEGGFFLATHVVRPVGAELAFSIYLPELDTTLSGVGEVRWVRPCCEAGNLPPGVGVRFTQLDATAELLLARYLQQLEGQS